MQNTTIISEKYQSEKYTFQNQIITYMTISQYPPEGRLLEVNKFPTNNKFTDPPKHTHTDIQKTHTHKNTIHKNTNTQWACQLLMETPAWRPNAAGQDTTARNEFQMSFKILSHKAPMMRQHISFGFPILKLKATGAQSSCGFRD